MNSFARSLPSTPQKRIPFDDQSWKLTRSCMCHESPSPPQASILNLIANANSDCVPRALSEIQSITNFHQRLGPSSLAASKSKLRTLAIFQLQINPIYGYKSSICVTLIGNRLLDRRLCRTQTTEISTFRTHKIEVITMSARISPLIYPRS